MTARDRMVLIVVSALVVLAAAWLMLVSPERQKAAKLQSQVTQASAHGLGAATITLPPWLLTELRALCAAAPSLGPIPAFIASLPGERDASEYREARVSVRNAAHFFPLTATWAGPVEHTNKRFGKGAPPLLWTTTNGAPKSNFIA